MRLLLDQMLDVEVSQALAGEGHDVLRVSDVGMATADDSEILQRAILDDRILITLDEHFGDWAVLPLNCHPGVIRVKAFPTTGQIILDVLLPFLKHNASRDLRHQLVIVRGSSVRWIDTAPL